MANDPRFIIDRDSKGEYRWRFRAGNGKILADSGEGYVNKPDCLHAIQIIKNEAADADSIDIT